MTQQFISSSGFLHCDEPPISFLTMDPQQHPVESPVSFGRRCAVLNLDLMSILIDPVTDTDEGHAFLSSCVRWNDAVHRKDPRPLTIFTSLFFSTPIQAELAHHDAPFTVLVRSFDTFQASFPGVQIDSRFVVDEKDIVLQKTRWYAGAGNALEQILRAQNIDTVVIVSTN